jgi:hypothetical protein
MNQQESDQILQQLFFQMENFFSETIENDIRLPEMSSDSHQDKREDMNR